MNNLSIIVAITKDFGIGLKNDLLTHIPGDLKRFKEITTGHSIIMGRKTLMSLPKWPLPNRRNIVISDNKTLELMGCEVVSLEGALDAVKNEDEAFIIGGGMIYKAFLPLVNKLYLTIVDKSIDADTFFPELNWDEWNEIERVEYKEGEKTDFAFSYVTLVRKSVF